MKNFTKKSILQKTIIAIIIALLLSNFIVPTYSHADFGGVLISPIVDLLCSVGDAVINLLQKCMTGNFGSGSLDFSFNAFMVEDDQFFNNSSYGSFQGSSGITEDSYEETINVDSGETEFEKGWLGTSNKYHIPVATYSPEQIFAGDVAGLDINFINPNTYTNQNQSSASILQSTISKWYVALRNLTVVGLLSVLVYVGIRIIISSTASDKAKYKQMLADWLVALCIVFFLHYIMAFTLTMTQSICTAIAGDGENNIYVNVVSSQNSSGTFKTNLLGLARFKTQYADFGQKIAYLIMYLALVIYTVIFTWFYLKRLLMMAFLTLIAPLVALTYPIDKMNDGKAQAFNSWLKEYVFNALIQPFHLIIYTVFVGTAMDLAATNIIYMIAALAFIMPAEKILRKFFGFEKAGAGTLGALAGGLTAGSLLGKLGKPKQKGSGKPSGGEKAPQGEKPPRFEKRHDTNEIEAPDNKEQESSDSVSEASLGGPSAADANVFNESEDPVARMKREALEEQLADGQISEEDLTEDQKRLLGMQDDIEMPEDIPEEIVNESNSPVDVPNNSIDKSSALKNWARAHNINGRSVGRAIGGVAKFGTRTAFKAGAGALAGAVALASGSGLAGAGAAFMLGSNVGEKLGNAAIGAGTALGRGAGRVGRALKEGIRSDSRQEGLQAAKDELLAGTALGRELDLAHGDTRYQDIADKRKFKEDQYNIQYLKDQRAAQNGGKIPSEEEIRKEMDKLDPYIEAGLTDIKDVLKAQKAEQYGISDKQSAIIAAIGKEKGITTDVLNDEKKFAAQRNNMIHEYINKGKDKSEATKLTDHTMNVLKAQQGVAHNLQKKDK